MATTPLVSSPLELLDADAPGFERFHGAPTTARRSRLRLALVSTDTACLVFGLALGAVAAGITLLSSGAAAGLVAGTVAGLLAARASGLYLSRVSSIRSVELSRLTWVALAAVTAVAVAHALLVPGSEVLPGSARPALGALTALTLTFLSLLVGRSTFDATLRERRRRGHNCRPVLILGDAADRDHLVDLIAQHPELGYRVAGVLGRPTRDPAVGPPWLGGETAIREAIHRTGATGVVLTSSQIAPDERDELVRTLLARGIHVQVSTGLGSLDGSRFRRSALAHQPLFYVEPVRLRRTQAIAKRALDLLLGGLLLVLTLPVLALAALAIWLEDRGPVFFVQPRIGRDGATFPLLKLRSMTATPPAADAEAPTNLRYGPLFKSSRDPRVTRVGRFLRLTSLDEVPQLVNVLKGEMSLVGPRPALPEEVVQFDEELMAVRHSVPPGLTGLWQVEARDNPSFAAYRRFDLFYVENWKVSLDLVILLLTAQAVIARVLLAAFPSLRRRSNDEAPAVLD